jgi:hypothetical protein
MGMLLRSSAAADEPPPTGIGKLESVPPLCNRVGDLESEFEKRQGPNCNVIDSYE